MLSERKNKKEEKDPTEVDTFEAEVNARSLSTSEVVLHLSLVLLSPPLRSYNHLFAAMVYWIREALEFAHVPDQYIEWAQFVFSVFALLIPLPILIAFYRWARPRQSVVPPYRERVLILGASSGVGKEIALAYATRGCRNIALVGRREAELEAVVQECHEQKVKGEEWEMSQEAPGWEKQAEGKAKGGILALPGDCTSAEDLVRIREACREGECSTDKYLPTKQNTK
jgi:hypothetical protein